MRSSSGASHQIVDIEGLRLQHLAFDGNRPRAGLQRLGHHWRICLVSAELVEVAVVAEILDLVGFSSAGAYNGFAFTPARRALGLHLAGGKYRQTGNQAHRRGPALEPLTAMG